MNEIQLAQTQDPIALSQRLAKSGLVPTQLRNKPDDILVVLLSGQELGIGPMMALRSMNVIEGKPVMSAQLMVGLCVKHSEVCEYFTLAVSNPTLCTYKTKRRGSDPVELTWTMAQATKAKLTGKDNWIKYPEAMLRARCSSDLARAVYPDLVANIYNEDEADDLRSSRPAVVELQPLGGAEPAPAREVYDTESGQVALIPEEPPASAWDPDTAPAAPVLAPFGKSKGKPLNELKGNDLDWLGGAIAESVKDPAKKRWRADNEKLLAAIQAEQQRRQGKSQTFQADPLESDIPF